MRKTCLLLFLMSIVFVTMAQKNGSIKGIAYDTAAKQSLAGVTVTVLEKRDSSLVAFTLTDNQGKFELKGLPNGEYRLLLTHVNYHNSNSYFTVSEEHKNIDLGERVMNDLSKTLEEVVVEGESPPITLIKDTIQYNAGSFKTSPNATVEQLLKRLPGIKVEKDGTVKAQGEKVSKVLVDGKEFFGNDPKVATKNLPADAVDKVQVYDKQSDQAQLTGFDDGNYEKTINLKLKKDKKKGLFGKVSAGGGTDQRYEGRFNLNSFKGARQLSAIGMANNTNAEGFSFSDILNFTGALAQLKGGMSGGNVNINFTKDDMSPYGLGNNANSGITTTWGGGLNYNDIIGKKLDFQSNYFYTHYDPSVESHIQRQYFLPDSSYYYNQDAVTNNLNNSHRLNLNMLYQLDSSSSLRIIPSFNYQTTRSRGLTNYETLMENKDPANRGFSNTTNNNEGYNFSDQLIYRKKFHRKGRTFSFTLQNSLNNSHGNGSLSSINSFYNPGNILAFRDTINQINTINGELRAYSARAVYTEPLGKKSLAEISLGHSNTNSSAEKTTNDLDPLSNRYNRRNSDLSNSYSDTYNYTTAGLRFRTQKRKFNYSWGATWQRSELEGKIAIPGNGGAKDSLIRKSFTDILPNARLTYNFSKFKYLSLNYSTATNQPTTTQLQPVADNSNALNITMGNPDLKPEFVHTLQGNLDLVSPYRSKNLFLFFTFQATQNKIVNYDTINQLGIKTTRPVNVNGVYNINDNVSYSIPVRFLKGRFEMSGDFGYFKGRQFINGVENRTRTYSIGPRLRLDMNPTDKLNFSLEASVNRNHSLYSLRPDLDTRYMSQEYSSTIDWEMPHRFFFSSEFNYTINSDRAAGFNTGVPIWNASLSRQVLKYNRGEIKFMARDILNRNVGISRNSNGNYIEDSRVTTLRRFFMLSFTYSLTKMGLNAAGGGGIRIINR